MSNKSGNGGPLWGELPPRESHKQEAITSDMIDSIWRQVLDDSNTTESDYHNDKQPKYIELPNDDPHVINTIHLHNQLRAVSSGSILPGISEVDTEKFPSCDKKINLLNFLPPKPSGRKEFRKVSTIHHLRPGTVRSLLKHAVMVLTAHLGYEKVSDVAIEMLTDIADSYFTKITKLLKIITEQPHHGFPDAIERLLVDAGIGTVGDLYEYYQDFVVKYEETMKNKVKDMAEKQQLELSTTAKMELDDAVNKLQFEEMDTFGNVPTLQLLDPDMRFPPSLDAGFQMLHNLEQDELII